jgi:hypothetical protein
MTRPKLTRPTMTRLQLGTRNSGMDTPISHVGGGQLRAACRRLLCLGTLSLSLLARPAAAQTDSAAARALFAEGRDLMKAERYEDACPKFEESLRLDQGIGTQFNLAHCWEKVGRTASAWALFLDVAAAARAGNQPQRETAARERAAALEPKLTRLRIEVPNPLPGMKVTRDDQDVGRPAWGTAMPLDPGDHVLVVTAPGKQQWSHDVKLPGISKTFSVTVPELEDLPVAKAKPSAPVEPEADASSRPGDADTEAPRDRGRGGGPNVGALVIGGVGVAAVAAGTVFALQSRSDNNEALKLCRSTDGDTCPTMAEGIRHDERVDDAKRERLFAFVGFGVGGAALITATILFVTADTGSDAAASSHTGWNVAPLLSDNGWGAALSGRF